MIHACYNCTFYKGFCSVLRQKIHMYNICHFYKPVLKQQGCMHCIYFEKGYCVHGKIIAIEDPLPVSSAHICDFFKCLVEESKPVYKKAYIRRGLEVPEDTWDYTNPELSYADWIYKKCIM